MPAKGHRSPLSPADLRYCQHYAVSLVQKTAYLAANPNYRGKNADKLGNALMRRQVIKDEIKRLVAAGCRRNEIDADLVLQELRKIATSDLRALFDEHGHLKSLSDVDDEMAVVVNSIETRSEVDDNGKVTHVSKVRIWDKLKALELLGKHLALFAADVNVGASPEDIRQWRQEGRDRVAPKKSRAKR